MLSVAAIVACVCAVVGLVSFVFSNKPPQHLYLVTSLTTLVVISLGSLEILARLSLGQGEIAALLAGRPIRRDLAMRVRNADFAVLPNRFVVSLLEKPGQMLDRRFAANHF